KKARSSEDRTAQSSGSVPGGGSSGRVWLSSAGFTSRAGRVGAVVGAGTGWWALPLSTRVRGSACEGRSMPCSDPIPFRFIVQRASDIERATEHRFGRLENRRVRLVDAAGVEEVHHLVGHPHVGV